MSLFISPYVFNTNLTWYSVFVLAGALVCYGISEFLYHKNPESKKCPDLVFSTFLLAFPAGLVGARIWFVLSELEYYMSDPISILKVWEGGLAVQGGVLLGAAVGILYANHQIRKHGLNMHISHLMDLIIPNILISQVIGRWGNFFNREVYGACVDGSELWFLPSFIKENMRGGEGIWCPSTQYAQPLFLYEGLLNLLGFILISVIIRKFFKKRVDGTLTAFYLVWYGAVRLSLENLRNEEFIMMWGNIRQSIVTSIAYIVLGIAYLVFVYSRKSREIKLAADNVSDQLEMAAQVERLEEEKEEEKEEKAAAETASAQKKKKTTTPKKAAPTAKKAAPKKAPAKATAGKKKAATKTKTTTAKKAPVKASTSKATKTTSKTKTSTTKKTVAKKKGA